MNNYFVRKDRSVYGLLFAILMMMSCSDDDGTDSVPKPKQHVLIGQWRPVYNVSLQDGKTYRYNLNSCEIRTWYLFKKDSSLEFKKYFSDHANGGACRKLSYSNEISWKGLTDSTFVASGTMTALSGDKWKKETYKSQPARYRVQGDTMRMFYLPVPGTGKYKEQFVYVRSTTGEVPAENKLTGFWKPVYDLNRYGGFVKKYNYNSCEKKSWYHFNNDGSFTFNKYDDLVDKNKKTKCRVVLKSKTVTWRMTSDTTYVATGIASNNDGKKWKDRKYLNKPEKFLIKGDTLKVFFLKRPDNKYNYEKVFTRIK